MMTDAQLKTLIVDNLNSVYGYTTELLLSKLLERIPNISPIPQFRIKNQLTDTYYTSLDALKNDLGNHVITKEILNINVTPTGENTQPVLVIFDNITVELVSSYIHDEEICKRYGNGLLKLAFTLNYLNDLDPALPLKIINIKLV